jgi:hypothetical protein
MMKLLIGLLALLAICVAVGVWRKVRGGPLLPPPTDGEQGPRNLKELHEQRK